MQQQPVLGSLELLELQRSYSYDVVSSCHSNASRDSNRVLIHSSTNQSPRQFESSRALTQVVSGLKSIRHTLVTWKRSRSGTILVIYFIFGFVTAALLWGSLMLPTWAIIRIGDDHEAQSNIFLGVSSEVPIVAYLTGLDRTAVRFCPGSPPICSSYIWWWWDASTWARAIESYESSAAGAKDDDKVTGDPHAILGEHSTALSTSWLAFNTVVELSGCIAILPYVIVLTTLFATLSVVAILAQSRQEADEETADIEREVATAVISRDAALNNGNLGCASVDESPNQRAVLSESSANQPPTGRWTRRRLLRSISSLMASRPLPNMCGRDRGSDPEALDIASESNSIGTSRLRWPEGLIIAAACGTLFVAAFIAFGHVYNEDFWESVYNNMETEFVHDVYLREPTEISSEDYQAVSLEYTRGIQFFLAAAVINIAVAIIALI